MYLGNLGHANNPDLLKDLGIGQILSVGETAMWRDGELEEWGPENVCIVQGVQDNGIDPLTDEFDRCLEFIGKLAGRVKDRTALRGLQLLTSWWQRARSAQRNGDLGALPSWRISKCHDLHRRSHESTQHVLPASLLFRSSPAA
jgi:hypothetical protein